MRISFHGMFTRASPNYTVKDTDLNQAQGGWISSALSQSGKTVACGNADGHVAIVSVENGSVFKLFDNTQNGNIELEERSVEALAWSPKAPILVTGNVKGDIIIYDITTWNIRRTITAKDAITGIKFVPGTNTLLLQIWLVALQSGMSSVAENYGADKVTMTVFLVSRYKTLASVLSQLVIKVSP